MQKCQSTGLRHLLSAYNKNYDLTKNRENKK